MGGAGRPIAGRLAARACESNSTANDSPSGWSDDHIRLLGSEYTSKRFDGELTADWGEFVFEAYSDVVYAKIF